MSSSAITFVGVMRRPSSPSTAVAGAELLGAIGAHVTATGERGDAADLVEILGDRHGALHHHEAVRRLFQVDRENATRRRVGWPSPWPTTPRC